MKYSDRISSAHVWMIEDCQDRPQHLSDVEAGFIDALEILDELSDAQVKRLEEIWERVMDAEK